MTGLRLKEDPREWRTFSLALAGSITLFAGVWSWRGGWGRGPGFLLILAVVLAVVAVLVPQRMRPLYRVGMKVGHFLGQWVGGFLLGICFCLVVVPLGVLLRWTGRDLLQLRRRPEAATYWEKARPLGPLDRMF